MTKQAKAPVYETEEPLIKPTSDLFTAVLYRAASLEMPILQPEQYQQPYPLGNVSISSF